MCLFVPGKKDERKNNPGSFESHSFFSKTIIERMLTKKLIFVNDKKPHFWRLCVGLTTFCLFISEYAAVFSPGYTTDSCGFVHESTKVLEGQNWSIKNTT